MAHWQSLAAAAALDVARAVLLQPAAAIKGALCMQGLVDESSDTDSRGIS